MKWINVKEISSPIPTSKAYEFGECFVIVGDEPGIGWHMSISHKNRYPSWEEIKEARYRFIPDEVTMAMLLPPGALRQSPSELLPSP
jgi:hypothetical protein